MTDRPWITRMIELVRSARVRQGHQLSSLQEGLVAAISANDPKYEPTCRAELETIRQSLSDYGEWSEPREWRISTSFDRKIIRTERETGSWFVVTVSCDEQVLTCGCPTLERAYAFMCQYEEIIVEQFYSVGPPWAEREPFEV